MPKNAVAPSNALVVVFRLAAVFTILAVAMGSVVCATGSGAACPNWPGCRPDQITPQWALNPLIEFVHRVVAISTGPLVLAAAVMARRLPAQMRRLRFLPLVALVGALAAGVFGRLVVVSSLPTWLGAVDLFCSLAAMTAMAVAAVMVGAPTSALMSKPAAQWQPRQVRGLTSVSLLVLVAMHVTGIFAAGPMSFTRCVGWPIWQLIDSDVHPWLQGLRLGLAVGGAALVLTTAVVAARSEGLRRWGITLAALFAAEMALGLVIRSGGINAGVAAAYSVLAVAVLACLGLLMAVAWAAQSATESTPQHPLPPRTDLTHSSRV